MKSIQSYYNQKAPFNFNDYYPLLSYIHVFTYASSPYATSTTPAALSLQQT